MPTILSIRPLDGYMMEINFLNGNTVILNLQNKLRTIRFAPLKDKNLFDSAVTDGESVIWNSLLEISTTEILQLVQDDGVRRGRKEKTADGT